VTVPLPVNHYREDQPLFPADLQVNFLFLILILVPFLESSVSGLWEGGRDTLRRAGSWEVGRMGG
jgi:hypothetical protein